MQSKAEQGWAVLRGRHPMQCAMIEAMLWCAASLVSWFQDPQVLGEARWMGPAVKAVPLIWLLPAWLHYGRGVSKRATGTIPAVVPLIGPWQG